MSDARLPRAPRRRAAEGLARRAVEGGVARRRRRAASSSARACASSRRQAGAYGAAKVWVADDAALEAPLPQPRVDVLAQLVARAAAIDTVLFGQSVLAADVAAGLAARLDAGLNWDLVDLVEQDGGLVGKRPALAGLGLRRRRLERRRRGSRSSAPARSTRAETGGEAQVDDVQVELEDFSTQATMVEQAHAESEGPSIEDARGDRRRRPRARRAGELQARGGARAGARRRGRRDARGRRRGLVSVRGAGRADRARPSRRSSTSPSASRARSSTRSGMQGSGDDRRDQQGRQRADLRVRGSRRGRRPARDRSEADRARGAAQGRDAAVGLPAAVQRARGRSPSRPIRRTSGSTSASSSSARGRPGSRARSASGSCSRTSPQRRRAARRGAVRGAREGQAARLAPALRRRRQSALAARGSSATRSGSTTCRSTARSQASPSTS